MGAFPVPEYSKAI